MVTSGRGNESVWEAPDRFVSSMCFAFLFHALRDQFFYRVEAQFSFIGAPRSKTLSTFFEPSFHTPYMPPTLFFSNFLVWLGLILFFFPFPLIFFFRVFLRRLVPLTRSLHLWPREWCVDWSSHWRNISTWTHLLFSPRVFLNFQVPTVPLFFS